MTLIGSAVALPVWSHAQSVETIFVERNASWHQISATEIVEFPYDPPFQFFAGWDVEDGTFSHLTLKKGGQSFDLSEDLEFQAEYDRVEELTAAWPAGTYNFSGTGSTVGAFSFDLTIGNYSPLQQRRFTNYEALQAINPSEDITIEWEPFTDYQDKGIIMLVASYPMSNGDYVSEFWRSPNLRSDGYPGLQPDTTSFVIPAGTLSGSDLGMYDLWVEYLSLELLENNSPFSDARFLNVTGSNTYMQMRVGEPVPSPELYLGFWEVTDSWADTESWLGWIYVRDHPWASIPALERHIYISEGSVEKANGGWVYLPTNPAENSAAKEGSDLYLGFWEVTDSWADTESWLGWLYVRDHPWVSVPAFERYIYVAEDSIQKDSGGWIYIPTK